MIDLSTLTFPELTRLYRVFAAYKGENLNANIPSLPNLEEVDTLIGGIANNVTEIENLQINDIDLSNVSAISDIFQHFTLGGDSVLDLSNWTLPNVPREERISISDPEDTYMKISGSIIATRHGVPSIAELDISSLDGSILFREIIKSSDFKKVKIKGENEYKGYVSELSYVEDSVTEKRLEELEIEVAE